MLVVEPIQLYNVILLLEGPKRISNTYINVQTIQEILQHTRVPENQ